MIPGRLVGASTIAGLTVISLGLAANAILTGSPPPDPGDPRRLVISSIDITTGARDATLSADGLVPGDTIKAAVAVANPSRQPMTYTMSRGVVSADGAALTAALILTVKTVGSSCAGDDGATLYHGPLDQAAFGSVGNGRPLAAATAEILCFRVDLPRDAGNGLQGAATIVSLLFAGSLQAAAR